VFLLARERQGLGLAVRRLARLPEAGPRPQVLLLDVSAKNAATYTLLDSSDGITPDSLRRFLAAAAAGKLPVQRATPVQSMTVAMALQKPEDAVTACDSYEEINPWEAALNCILCPITCPLMCAFRCCLGCCILSTVGAAVGVSGMSGMAAGALRCAADVAHGAACASSLTLALRRRRAAFILILAHRLMPAQCICPACYTYRAAQRALTPHPRATPPL
jgi:hypothetical protein